jgi:hypothetical protein
MTGAGAGDTWADRLLLVEHLAIVAVLPRAGRIFIFGLVQSRLIDVAHGHDFSVRTLVVGRSAGACADGAHATLRRYVEGFSRMPFTSQTPSGAGRER